MNAGIFLTQDNDELVEMNDSCCAERGRRESGQCEDSSDSSRWYFDGRTEPRKDTNGAHEVTHEVARRTRSNTKRVRRKECSSRVLTNA
jgi:hypothetical protein